MKNPQQRCTCGLIQFKGEPPARIQNLLCPFHGSPEFVPAPQPEDVALRAAALITHLPRDAERIS